MGIKLIVPPVAVEPVGIEEVKQALRVQHTMDDAVLASYRTAAREWVERRIQSKIATETWELVIDAFPVNEIRLPFGPAQSIVHIKYDDADGNEQTVPDTDYALDSTSSEPWVFSDAGWPTALDAFNAVRIRFVTGYADLTLIPAPIRAALILKIKELYDKESNAVAIHDLLTNWYKMVA